MRCWHALIAMVLGMTTATAQSVPTATEIFELKKKCNAEGNLLLPKILKSEATSIDGSVVTNYDVNSNNCYAVFTINLKYRVDWPAAISTKNILINVLSGEILARKWIFNLDEKQQNSYILDRNYTGNENARADVTEVQKYFDKKMDFAR